ncbi:E3 ubiquitin-protein ligase UHRF1 [Amphibalanus amphitrite]|uniref:RING-type E3 ubiquitin transferase n=1 Tax=Amphibalanus amphitrite TaxID=1232801 RepID=A0A6A4W4F1_AMPAM|nr:E3 ubiquitin-protein ligase UHRF1 [Amphibalanus amphitrite]KAF0298620.1 E3 ubiquitin-protein ligase UHRF1 [Amphibalanus amphitrite]
MFVKVRTMDGKSSATVVISKLTTVQEFRQLVREELDVPPESQRLFFRGKQETDDAAADWEPITEDDMYREGDCCDARDPSSGAWFEAVVKGLRAQKTPTPDGGPPRHQYAVQFEGYEDESEPIWLNPADLRERASVTLPFSSLVDGMEVLVNYNVDEPDERGFWFDAIVTGRQARGRRRRLEVTALLGADRVPVAGCLVKFVDEVMERGMQRSRKERRDSAAADNATDTAAKREVGPTCKICRDRPDRDCRVCGCHVCHSKSQPEKQIMCDECDMPYHISCLTPPLEAIPEEGDWYCPECKTDTSEVVLAGQKLKASKRKSRMASVVNKATKRDWGKGMATAGRQKQCTIVPTNHMGPVPGVEVGMRWQYRIQASEAGVHRPHVAGIAGREKEGAFSIVLSGGYEDDVDNGEEFFYTGSGGRDLSGNKRTAGQSCDQQLTRMNKALALNCNAKINSKTGAEAEDWRGGRPVRVIRSYKLGKHSKYAPNEGLRYDGVYKIVKYWPEKGQSGFLVWRYLLRRDDPTPAPWTTDGRRRILELGIQDMVRVEGATSSAAATDSGSDGDRAEDGPPTKRSRPAAYSPEPALAALIEADEQNRHLWDECRRSLADGKLKFLDAVTETFMCICCQELVCTPVTLPCRHNVCQPCVRRSFKAEVYSCPACRHDLGKSFSLKANGDLFAALKALFPGYQQGR